MPSRAYTSFLLTVRQVMWALRMKPCQCPLGFIPHFYIGDFVEMVYMCDCVNALSGLYLISTMYLHVGQLHSWMVSMPSRAYTSFLLKCREIYLCKGTCVNALSGWYLISTVPLQKPRFYAVFRVCFCRYLSEYSDNSRFSCMLTFWTYLMRCTYP